MRRRQRLPRRCPGVYSEVMRRITFALLCLAAWAAAADVEHYDLVVEVAEDG